MSIENRWISELGMAKGAIGLLFFSVILTGCAPALTPGWQSKMETCPSTADIGRLIPGDKIELRVYHEPDMSGPYTVSPGGKINFPLLGEVEVVGLRCDEVEKKLSDALGKEHLAEPSVQCSNQEGRRFAITVDGEVEDPGIFDFRSKLMLTDAIAEAGGVGQRASAVVVVHRRLDEGKTSPIVVPFREIVTGVEPNVCLHPGDLVYVPESAW